MSLSKACVIAATNSQTDDGQTIDYVSLAGIAAERVKYYLGIPVFLLTRTHTKQPPGFDGALTVIPRKLSPRVMLAGSDTIKYDWYNDLRIDAYKDTAKLADTILMIDADYMVSSDMLKPWLESDAPLHIFDHAHDVTGRDSYASLLPSQDIPMRWATAICWRHCDEARAIFDTARMVRDNYEFYALMLGLPKSPFRNDVAFSVACHLNNVPLTGMPGLNNLPPDSELFIKSNEHSPDTWMIQNGNRVNLWSGDLHVLNKSYAMDPTRMDELRLRDVRA